MKQSPLLNTIAALLALTTAALAQASDDDWQAAALRPGDVLRIDVFRVAEFNRTVRLEEDGEFNFPLCGTIQAMGKTTREIAAELTKRMENQITSPHVDVFVESWGPRTVYLLGELKSGSMSVELPTFGRMTALQAISGAGGFTESADLTNVAVLRRDAKTKRLTRMKIDVSALVSKNSGGDEFTLWPEDTLIVPKAPPVYVSGMVGAPGFSYIDTQRPPLCSEMIVRFGGLTSEADADNICIVRTNQDGVQERLTVSLLSPTLGQYESDTRIMPGDHIIVGLADKIYVLGEVNKPGPLEIPPNRVLTASQAIALAGSFTRVAKQSAVTLIRDRMMTEINLKKLYNNLENLERDVELKNGDILFVPESFW
ncbi:MAG: Polysaccharide biosynthesis/export protein [Lentisphaerae bacterium ADurb.Bin082]|nr:MAG: Polysaccharide biosynthesis/export protein [Lentisphaerae bacterium ADurb.Bin082]